MRIRCAGLVKINNGIALMHRRNVKETPGTDKPFGEYYVFPGGGLEENDTSMEEAVKREVMEEFGIDVDVKELVFERVYPDGLGKEMIYLCEYESGTFGTGNGPEFSGDPKYADRGEYLPEIISYEDVKNLRILPQDMKELVIKLIEEKKI